MILWERGFRPLIQLLYGSSGRLGAGNIQRQKMRTTLTVAALMIGVSMIVIVQSMTSSFKGDLFEWINAYIGGDLFVTSSVPMRGDLQRRLQEVNSVEWVTPMRYLDVKWIKEDGVEEPITLMAIDPQTHGKVASILFTDSAINLTDAMNRLALGDAVFISSVISEKYGLKQGEQISLRTRSGIRPFVIAGIVVDFYNQGLVIHGSWNDLRRYFRVEDASAYLLKVEQGSIISDVEANIIQLYGKQEHLTVDSNIEIKERILQLLNQAFSMFDVLALLAVVVASLGVVNTLTMNVMERTQEIGMLRSIGMTRLQVLGMILAEALVMGVAGGGLGLGFGYILSRILLLSMTAMSGYRLDFNLPQEGILVSLLVVLGISQLAAILPAMRAARTRILTAIQYE
jgi:putative ABC transport system permease protein